MHYELAFGIALWYAGRDAYILSFRLKLIDAREVSESHVQLLVIVRQSCLRVLTWFKCHELQPGIIRPGSSARTQMQLRSRSFS